MRIPIEQSLGGHDHAVHAVAALCSLFVDKSLLQRMRMRDASQAFQRRDLLIAYGAHRERARAHRLARHDHGARTALRKPATESRAIQLKVITQHIEKRSCGIRINGMRFSVYFQRDSRHERVSFQAGSAREGNLGDEGAESKINAGLTALRQFVKKGSRL
jgi:hypothetical protein